MDLKGFFEINKNEEREQWEFTPNEKVNSTSYTVAFCEADNEEDAWITLFRAIQKSPEFRMLSDVPCSLHFVVINVDAFQAIGQIDKRVVTIKLTAEQQNELRQKVNRVDNASFFDVMMSFD